MKALPRRLDESERSGLEQLLDRLIGAHLRCAADRKRLQDDEWGKPEAPSILGEAEVWSDEIAGHISSWAHGVLLTESDPRVRALEAAALDRRAVLQRWRKDQGARYPAFDPYLAITEEARLSALESARS